MIMTDISNEYDKTKKDDQALNNGVTPDRKGGRKGGRKVDKNIEIDLPVNRVIRKRFSARTIAIHLSALPPELQAFKESNDTSDNTYLTKQDLPDKIYLTVPNGERKVFSKDEAWEFADEAGSKLEWDMLPDTLSGKATALFSTTGQGVYANYGRPSMDFSGFFYDNIRASKQAVGGIVPQEKFLLGPLFITVDAISAASFTALGHITRGAPLTNKTVLSDIVSTGIFEGGTSWASAKLGVFTGVRAIRLVTVLPIPGVHLAAIPIGFLTGAITAIFAKRIANQYKDKVIDETYRYRKNSKNSEMPQEAILV